MTHSIFGRTGKPGSHRLYRADPLPPTTQFKDVGGAMLLEVRSTGSQTVVRLDPSQRRTNPVDEDGDPARVSRASPSATRRGSSLPPASWYVTIPNTEEARTLRLPWPAVSHDLNGTRRTSLRLSKLWRTPRAMKKRVTAPRQPRTPPGGWTADRRPPVGPTRAACRQARGEPGARMAWGNQWRTAAPARQHGGVRGSLCQHQGGRHLAQASW